MSNIIFKLALAFDNDIFTVDSNDTRRPYLSFKVKRWSYKEKIDDKRFIKFFTNKIGQPINEEFWKFEEEKEFAGYEDHPTDFRVPNSDKFSMWETIELLERKGVQFEYHNSVCTYWVKRDFLIPNELRKYFCRIIEGYSRGILALTKEGREEILRLNPDAFYQRPIMII